MAYELLGLAETGPGREADATSSPVPHSEINGVGPTPEWPERTGVTAARGAIGVLSSGMSSRLFTEVREKRGLCYSVYASHETLLDQGSVFCYAGTRAERTG